MAVPSVVVLLGSLLLAGVAEAGPSSGDEARSRHIVVLHEGVDPDRAAADHRRSEGARVDLIYRHALNGYAGEMSAQAAANIARDPRVDYVEADQVVHALGHSELPTGVDRAASPASLHVVPSHLTIDGTDDLRVDVDVAVIDTGIDHTHPELDVVGGADCTGGSPFKSSCSTGLAGDGNGHGTHVAGTIGAIDNGSGVVGVAPGARLHAVKVLRADGSGYMSWIAAGIDWVTARGGKNGPISVANMSLGCGCTSSALDQALSKSVSAGVVHVVAAGNSSADLKDSAYSPARHPDVITVSALADFNGVSGGGGAPTCRTDQDDTLASFSNRDSSGLYIDVAAPGVCIRSTVPGGGYATWSGTSMASPHVAGAAALITSQGNKTSKTGALSVRTTIENAGNLAWVDDSGDGVLERLLDVSSSTVFTPTTVVGSGGGAPVVGDSEAPTVSITDPTGGTVSGTKTVTFSATDDIGVSKVELYVDGALEATDDDGGNGWQVAWDTTGTSDGQHSLTARAYDAANNVGTSASVSVDVQNAASSTSEAGVTDAGISFTTTGGKNSDRHLEIAVLVLDELGGAVANAGVSIALSGATSGAATATTGSDGKARFAVKNASAGDYTVTVTDVAPPSPLTWDGYQATSSYTKASSTNGNGSGGGGSVQFV